MGLGLLVLLALPGFWTAARLDLPSRATGLAAALALGIDAYYALALACGRPATAVVAALALAALGWFGTMIRARQDFRAALALGLGPYLLLVAVAVLAAPHILLRPLEADDARFMWFHHARIIFYFGDLDAIGRWGTDPLKIAQAYYPKLVPLLAATAAQLAGFWNEYFPKAALLALLLPPAVAALAFWRERITFVFVLLAFFAVPHEYMWSGMMDGYLALYVGFGVMHLGRWLESRNAVDLVAGLAFLGVAAGLKSETNLILVALAMTVAALSLRSGGRAWEIMRSLPPMAAVPAAVAFSGFILWHVLRWLWHLEIDLQFSAWDRMFARLGSRDALLLIGQHYLFAWRTLTSFAFIGAVYWLFRPWRAGAPPGVALALGTALLYFCGILLVYLMTPHDLYFQLATSADRVLMTPRALVFAAVALWLQAHERFGRALGAA